MDYFKTYQEWLDETCFDAETIKELKEIENDENEIKDRFYRELAFGTGGLRGIIGAGTNRMNRYTVRKATQGVANYIKKLGKDAMKKGVVIAYDSRIKSDFFAKEAACVLAGNDIKVYLFDDLRPTPELSYAVRKLGCVVGIVVTASHNPKEYNGYKVYGVDGAQLALENANIVMDEINNISSYNDVLYTDNDSLIEIISKEIDDAYIKDLQSLVNDIDYLKEKGESLSIIYTPLHGSGLMPVLRVLNESGFTNVKVVAEQEKPDGSFPTVQSPNPENKEAFELGIEYAKKYNSDVIIATDPDSDRLGVFAKNNDGEFETFTGNQIGSMLLSYIVDDKIKNSAMPKNPFAVKTIVTTKLTNAICSANDIKLYEVLTGFKYIGDKIFNLDENGDENFLFGYEESYGYLQGTFVRDKDAVVASLLVAQLALKLKEEGKTLSDYLNEIYAKYGCYKETLVSYTLKGFEGVEKIKNAMKMLREGDNPFSFTKALRDYQNGTRTVFDTNEKFKLDLPESNVLYFECNDEDWFCVRPSGTEPKIKLYFGVKSSIQDADNKLNELKENVTKVVKEYLKLN